MSQDIVVQSLCERTNVEQFIGSETAAGRSRDVADIVGAGAAGRQTEVLQMDEDLDDILRAQFANLEVGARGDVSAACAPVRDFGDAAQLGGGDFAGGQ